MDMFSSAPAKVLSVLSPSNSIKSNDGFTSEPDAPIEYRNLLMDMCGGKSDHVLWISCLKSYDWYGDGKFSFNMDKFGVPVLKNGDYKLNLAVECIDRYVGCLPETEMRKILWEGNYSSPTEEDNVFVSVKTEAKLINKAANALKSLGIQRGDKVLIILPAIVQLPTLIMGCIRIGAVFSLFNPLLNVDNNIEQAVDLIKPKLLITADGFWFGDQLVKLKEKVNTALRCVNKYCNFECKVLMLRHAGTEPGLPPMRVEQEILGRRPVYSLQFPFNYEKEYKWTKLISAASDECPAELMDTEDMMIQNLRLRNGQWVVRSYTTSQMALLAAMLQQTFGQESCATIWPLLDIDNLLFVTSILAIPLSSSSLLLFEGSLTFPDTRRFFEILDKHKVEKIMLNLNSMKMMMDNNIGLDKTSKCPLRLILTVLTNKTDNDVAKNWIKDAFPGIKHISVVY